MPEPTQGPSYDDAGLLLQAAISGQGVALARSVLAADDLAAGRLIRVCDAQVEDSYGWFIAWREPLRCEQQDFDAFRGWLEKEAGIAEP
jgi:LysR family glycine cleavage system transcriptional activator